MGKGSGTTVGFHYRPAFHSGLGRGPIDAYLEFRGGDRTAWSGELTSSGTISINAPNLFGGEKDQGGIVGDVDVMFGTADQEPNTYLVSAFGPQTVAWRGMATVAFKGGRYGAMSPYPQKASHKIRKIKEGWDEPGCWYPEKAEIPMGAPSIITYDRLVAGAGIINDGYGFTGASSETDNALPRAFAVGSTAVGSDFAGEVAYAVEFLVERMFTTYLDPKWAHPYAYMGFWGGDDLSLSVDGWLATEQMTYRTNSSLCDIGCTIPLGESAAIGDVIGGVLRFSPVEGVLNAYADFYRNGEFVGTVNRGIGHDYKIMAGVLYYQATIQVRTDPEAMQYWSAYGADDGFPASLGSGLLGINPAHALVYVRTDGEYGREPRAAINEASLRAAADKLHAEGFGICTSYDPSQESPLEFEARICRLIGGSFGRSLVDGKWYLDLARGDYDIASLPVLTDDDILSFSEKASTTDGAVNSVAVKYFDPERKESIITPAVRALGLVRRFGENHLVLDCPEIPTATLALRKAEMELRARTTPTRAFDLVTTRKTYGWRPNQYFRLQSVKRGITDMVCLVGEVGAGTLRSGGIRLKASQDIYGLPETTYADVEVGVDTRPAQTPMPISLQAAFESPYVELAQRMTRSDLAFLPAEAGYLMAVAKDPSRSRDYSLRVEAAGGGYTDAGTGEWCPTALIVEATGYGAGPFTLAEGYRLDAVSIGQAALVGGELCRVDSIDPLVLGRGCGDTVAVPHAAGTRIWFYDDHFAGDQTEYTAGETISVRLLTNTGSQQLAEWQALPLEVSFAHRQARPYPPGMFRLDGEVAPAYLVGEVEVTWAHRDRLLQADQLVDAEVPSIGPEAGVGYVLRWYLDGVLIHTHTIAGSATAQAYTPVADGLLRIELEAERDGLPSWQRQVREQPYYTESPDPLLAEGGEPLTMAGAIIFLR